ncbi:unnamed protein product, partial [marine sediment metagenome]
YTGNGKAEVWVKVPSIASGADTSIWIWWETAGADTQPAEDANFGKEQTWDDGGNDYFKMVHHMKGANAAALDDSTQYDNDVSADGGTPGYNSTGKVGQAVDFVAASDEYIEVANSASLEIVAAITISASVNFDDKPGAWNTIISGNNQWWWNRSDADLIQFAFMVGTTVEKVTLATGSYSTGTWYRFTATYDGETVEAFNGGTSLGTDADPSGNIDDRTEPISIGGVSGVDYLNGLIDEVCISATVRADAWINAEYENQNDPNAFIVEGTPEATAVGVAPTAVLYGPLVGPLGGPI